MPRVIVICAVVICSGVMVTAAAQANKTLRDTTQEPRRIGRSEKALEQNQRSSRYGCTC